MGETPTPAEPKVEQPRRWPWILAVLALIGLGGYWIYPFVRGGPKEGQKSGESSGPRSVPVMVATARAGDLSLFLTGLGSVTPLNTATIRSRVDGELTRVAYTEGQFVKAGDLLAEIDPRPFQALLTQAEGQLHRDEALLKNARIDLERDRVAKDAISAQQLATQEALVAQYEGIVKSDQGQVEATKLQLSYCRITAPFSGRIGLRLVDAGNIVHASDAGGLAVITQIQPIAVVFTLPSDQLPQVLNKTNAGKELSVEAYDRDLKNRLAAGKLLAIDNQIDPTTGTVRLKGIFANEDNALFPNQFVNARLLVDVKKGSILVPTPAVQRGPQSSYVYAVKADSTVEMREVAVGPSEGELTSIDRGLAAGEVVVTDGVDKLQEGTKVAPRTENAPKAEGATGPRAKP